MDSEIVRYRIEQIFEAMRALRICWIVSLGAALVLTVPPQVRDLYRTLAETAQTDFGSPKIVLTAVLLLLAAFMTYYVGKHRAFVHVALNGEPPPLLAHCLRWGPPLCAAILILGVTLGMYLTRLDVIEIPDNINPDMDRVITQMKGTANYLFIAAAAGAGLAFVVFIATGLWSGRPRTSNRAPLDFAFDWPERLLWLLAVGALIGSALLPSLAVPLSQSVGSMAIFLAFITLLLMGLSLLQTLSDRQGIPWVLMLVLWGTLLAVLDINKPQIRTLRKPVVEISQVTQKFEDWYRARKDREAFGRDPYPVFLISAEAGGLYAAQFAAKVMARLQDHCPSFSQHVFAVSGVSGGSLGAAIFSSLAKQDAQNAAWQPCKADFAGPVAPASFEGKVNAILRNDFLSPILSRALFADVAQHFLPTELPHFLRHYLPPDWRRLPGMYRRAVARFSRGRALDETIIQAWAAQTVHLPGAQASNAFAMPFLDQWRPDSVNPALMLNTTSVNDGRQIFIAPFNMAGERGDYDNGLLYWQPAFPRNLDMSLATAVSLSGRFPWVMPASTVGSDQFAVVDGAYFESSGIETLSMVRNELRQYEVAPTGGSEYPYIKVYVIVIGSLSPPADDSPLVLDEATPPVRTLLKARDRRGYNAFSTLRSWDANVECPPRRPESKIENPTECTPTLPVVFRLNYDYFNLPLGWTLSDGVSQIIEQHVHGRCRDNPDPSDLSSDPRKILEENKLSGEAFVPYYLTPSKQRPPAVPDPCPRSQR